MTIVFNAAAMEEQRAQDEATMNAQISEMESTRAQYEAQAAQLESEAASLESQAAEQDAIAATAMKMEYYTDSRGKRQSRMVPDTAKRAAAKQQANTLRDKASQKKQQAADLKAQAAELTAAIAALQQAIAANNAYMYRLMEIVQNTDLSHAQMMEQIIEDAKAYNDQMEKLRDSFNDNFPLTGNQLARVAMNTLTEIQGNVASVLQKTLNDLLGMDPGKVQKTIDAFYNGLPKELRDVIPKELIIGTDDGFALALKSLDKILRDLGYKEVNNRDVNKIYDDWYIYGIVGNKGVTYSMLKMRELESDPRDRYHDGNASGTAIPFVSIDLNLFKSNDEKLERALNHVTNPHDYIGDVKINKEILNYFLNPESKGDYVIAEAFVDKIIREEMQNGTLSTKMSDGSDLTNKRIIEFLRNNPDVIFNEKNQTLTILDLTHDAKRAILAARSGNTSYNSFSAETLFHAQFTKDAALVGASVAAVAGGITKNPVIGAGGGKVASNLTLRSGVASDTGIEEERLPNNPVTAPYYYDNMPIVKGKINHFGDI